jgi:hypothetical protein
VFRTATDSSGIAILDDVCTELTFHVEGDSIGLDAFGCSPRAADAGTSS